MRQMMKFGLLLIRVNPPWPFLGTRHYRDLRSCFAVRGRSSVNVLPVGGPCIEVEDDLKRGAIKRGERTGSVNRFLI